MEELNDSFSSSLFEQLHMLRNSTKNVRINLSPNYFCIFIENSLYYAIYFELKRSKGRFTENYRSVQCPEYKREITGLQELRINLQIGDRKRSSAYISAVIFCCCNTQLRKKARHLINYPHMTQKQLWAKNRPGSVG